MHLGVKVVYASHTTDTITRAPGALRWTTNTILQAGKLANVEKADDGDGLHAC